jgi:hypothetical protein
MTADRGSSIGRSTDRLNLSRRPFVNKRPVTRAAVLLWGLGFLLLLTNVFSFWSYLESSREKRAEVKAHQGLIVAESAAIAQREGQVARLDLARQNDEVSYLNGKIAQRTFSWSQLLDRLAEVLPNDVRLQRLAPRGLADDREERQVRRLSRRGEPDRVVLQVDGQAKSDEALLELVDNLFADPAFVEPNLTREAHENGLIRFNLTVGYLPNAVVAGPVRPPRRHWKLTPEPSAPSASQAGPPAAPGAVAPPRPTFPSAAPGAAPQAPGGFRPAPGMTSPVPGAFPGDAARTLPRRPPVRPTDSLRGIGSPLRPRTTPPPQEGGRR